MFKRISTRMMAEQALSQNSKLLIQVEEIERQLADEKLNELTSIEKISRQIMRNLTREEVENLIVQLNEELNE